MLHLRRSLPAAMAQPFISPSAFPIVYYIFVIVSFDRDEWTQIR